MAADADSILHLAIFITLCEGFLGVEPHFGLWKRIFAIKRHSSKKVPFVVGGVGFMVRADVKYFEFPMKESVQNWRKMWFYMKDRKSTTGRSGLPQFVDVLSAQPKATWRNTLSAEERSAAEELYQKLQGLMETGDQTMVGTKVTGPDEIQR